MQKTLKILLTGALVSALVPTVAMADESAQASSWIDAVMDVVQDNTNLPPAEGEQTSGVKANSWRFTNGYPNDVLSETAGSLGFDSFGAWSDLGQGDLDISSTWTKPNGISTYTVRKTPTSKDTIIKVPGSLAVGIDVSAHNNQPGGTKYGPIDWQKVKSEGVTFALIRCGYGSDYANQDDQWFAQNYRGAKEAGLQVGVYLYSYAPKATGAAPSATNEAQHVLRVLRENGIKPSDLALPVYLDLEDKSQEKLKRGTLGAIAKEFCSVLQNAGYTVGIYANQYWFNTVLKNDDPVFDPATMKKNGWSRWVARYAATTSSEVEGTDIWQFTCIGKVEGTPKTYCDVNFAYLNFADNSTPAPADPAPEKPAAVSFKVAYKLNGGKNHKSNPTKATGTLTLKNPTRSGYTFGGWYTDKKLTKKVTKVSAANASKGKVTLYAKWFKNYKVTYKLNGGVNHKSNPKKYGGTLLLKNPTRTGYTFVGWYTDKKLTKKATKLTVKKNRTVYAKWAKVTKGTYVVTSDNGLFIRETASTTAPILGGLAYNQQVRVVKVNQGWGQLESGGWINLSYARPV